MLPFQLLLLEKCPTEYFNMLCVVPSFTGAFIFSFGIYELFISEIDAIKNSRQAKVLEVHSLDQLKDKIGKVIVMVLVVNFFQRVLHAKFSTPLEMVYLALSILALCLGLYFLHKSSNH